MKTTIAALAFAIALTAVIACAGTRRMRSRVRA